MVVQTRKDWDATLVDCPSASIPKLVVKLYGGQSITLKSLAASGKSHYVGSDNLVSSTNCYKLESGETLTLSLPANFGVTHFIEIWVLPEIAGEDVCYVKLIDKIAVTEATT